MDLTPQLLHDAEFREARRGGYDTRDVDEFLERVAVGVGELHDRLRQAIERADAAEARAVAAERAASEAPRSREADDLDETLKRTLVLAQRTADAAIKEAEEQASATLAAAQLEADRVAQEARELSETMRQQAEEEARRGADEARERALNEINALNATRDTLQSDVNALTAHLDDQRNRLRQAADSLQHLLDDPAGLREAPAPALSGLVVEPPAPPVTADEAPAVDEVSEEPPELDEWGAAVSDERPLRADLPTEPARPLRADEPVDPLAERDPGDEEYLAELRKAMTDDSPLGPREEEGGDAEGFFDVGRSRRDRSRFGRRG